jgi:hypothetical protein
MRKSRLNSNEDLVEIDYIIERQSKLNEIPQAKRSLFKKRSDFP